MRNFGKANAKLVATVNKIDAATEIGRRYAEFNQCGGMASKLKAAEIVMRAGIPMLIGNGCNAGC